MSTIDPRLFALIYRAGSGYDPALPEVQQALRAHQSYLAHLRSAGIMRQGGAFGNDLRSYPVIAVKAGGSLAAEQVARSVGHNDPAVEIGVLDVDVAPWHPRYGLLPPFYQGS